MLLMSNFSFFLVAISAILGLSSTSIFSIWFFLELNLLSFVAYIIFSSGGLSSLSSVRYFVAQGVSSMIFMIVVIFTMKLESSSALCSVVTIPLFIKMGVAPLHFWYVEFIQDSEWGVILIASTLQKILPAFLVHICFIQSVFLLSVSALMSVALVLGQVIIKKIMAYSSVFSSIWLCASSQSLSLMLVFLLAYSLALLSIMSVLVCNFWNSLSQIKAWSLSGGEYVVLSLNFMSAAGMPPFLGFMTKLWVLQAMEQKWALIFILLFGSIFYLFFYLRIFINSFMTSKCHNLTHGFQLGLYPSMACLTVSAMLPVVILCLSVLHKNFWCF